MSGEESAQSGLLVEDFDFELPAELIVQEAESYQLLLERLERAETLAAIRRGMEQAERGGGIPLAQAEESLRQKHGFSN